MTRIGGITLALTFLVGCLAELPSRKGFRCNSDAECGEWACVNSFCGDPLNYSQRVIETPGLLHYFRLGEPSGSSAADEKGGLPGVLSQVDLGEPSLAGDGNTSASFDGVNSHLDLGDRLDFSGRQPFTFDLLAKPRSLDSTSRRLISKDDSAVSDQGYLLYVTQSRTTFSRVRDGSYDTTPQNQPLQVGQRVHIAVTFNGATLQVFLNGSLSSSIASSLEILNTTIPLRIGAKATGGVGFNGWIDEVAVYDRALSTTEIGEHADAAGL
jgi:hypothetical protein